jgi:hypothetical protein
VIPLLSNWVETFIEKELETRRNKLSCEDEFTELIKELKKEEWINEEVLNIINAYFMKFQKLDYL